MGFIPVPFVGAAIVGVSLLSLLIVKLKTGSWTFSAPPVRESGVPVHETK